HLAMSGLRRRIPPLERDSHGLHAWDASSCEPTERRERRVIADQALATRRLDVLLDVIGIRLQAGKLKNEPLRGDDRDAIDLGYGGLTESSVLVNDDSRLHRAFPASTIDLDDRVICLWQAVERGGRLSRHCGRSGGRTARTEELRSPRRCRAAPHVDTVV